jgi:hypothetical protein
MYIGLHVKFPVIVVRFGWKLNFLDRFPKNSHISNAMKIRCVGAELFHADRPCGRIDRQTCSFVNLSILIVMYVPFCVFCPILLLCVLFVCKSLLDYCHRDIGALFDYPNWGFSVLFIQLQGKRQGITRKDGARSALPSFLFLFNVMNVPFFVFCVLFVCKCVLYCCTVCV